MIYSILIIACLAAEPTDCREYEQPATELSANPGTAFIEAQTLVAKWLERRPSFKLKKFRLLPGRGA